MKYPFSTADVRQLYDQFDQPVTTWDCGQLCAPHNPRGVPFCCDICEAVPAAYHAEWEYLRAASNLWHVWRGDECAAEPVDPNSLAEETPPHMLLLACRGAAHCERPNRSLSCRQFPFFPYITADGRFIGLAYHWDFEATCWVISHLSAVTAVYRQAFVQFYDALLMGWEEDYESYAALADEMRAHFLARKRRIPLLHRNGRIYLLSPASERRARVDAQRLPKFGPYRFEQVNDPLPGSSGG